MNNDVSSNLRSVKASSKSSLVSRIVDTQKYKESKDSSWDLERDLTLLTPEQGEDRALKYTKANKHRVAKYTALSYPWAHSVYEDSPEYTWRINKDAFSHQSNVRDAVLDRATKFMRHSDIDYLWIDAECINQLDDDEKQHMMAKMYLIYANSSHPLALLFVPIRTRSELDLLARLLSGKLTKPVRRRKWNNDGDDEHVLASDISPADALTILDLLLRILSDDWWSRAWCFQEEYLSMSNITLLLPTFVDVSGERDPCRYMKFINGEVAIRAKGFRYTVTRFVFAYVATTKRMLGSWTLDQGLCRHILEKAGRYTLISRHGRTLNLDSEGKAMTTQILADLRGKKYTVASDLIHISSNCNYYVSTLNTRRLNETNESLAVSMMALFFMNGEVFKNDFTDGPSPKEAADLNVFGYLKRITFDEFPANDEPGEKAKLRRCRFISPVLTDLGVRSFGHVWQIDEVLHLPPDMWLSTSSSQLSEDNSDIDVNADEETWRVLNIIRQNLPTSCRALSKHIHDFLAHKFDMYWQDDRPTNADMSSVAAAMLVRDICSGRSVGLGHVVGSHLSTGSTSIKLGLFTVDRDVNKREPIYAFTAWQPGLESDHWYERILKENKHVSLRIGLDEPRLDTPTLCLRTKALIHSLCFDEGIEQIPATFLWPRSLLDE